MKIDSLKDLKKLMALCREQGIDAIEVDGIKMNLGQKPYIAPKTRKASVDTTETKSYTPGGITEEVKIPTDMMLTEEQLLMWSVEQPSDQ